MSAHSITSRGLAGRKIPQGTLTPIGDLLFSASEPGALYDPSDISTLFQDEAGTTPVTAVEQFVGRILDKSGRGNHATQATAMKRPVYSRRVNLLTYFGWPIDETWGSPPASVRYVEAPDGTNTAVVPKTHAVSNRWQFAIAAGTYPNGTKLTYSFYRKTVPSSGISGQVVTAHSLVGLSVISSIESQPDSKGFTRVSVVLSVTDSAVQQLIRLYLNGVVGADDIAVWGHQLDIGEAATTYQRIYSATDYDAGQSKFPAYRRLDGVDDSHASATGGGGTAGFFLSQAITVLGGAGTARTLFSDAGTNTGYIVRLNTSNQLELAAGDGTAYTTVATSGTLAVGTTNVIQAWDDGTNLNVKIGNGATASIARPVVSAGTAGYTMGQDNGASTGYFNGRIYSTIYRKDSGLTQVQRESAALYQRQKARMP